MRPTFLAVFSILFTTLAYADVAPATQPMQPGVMIVPFQPTGDPGKYGWISQAIHDDLVADLSRNRDVRVLTAPATQPADVNAAVAMGRDNGAAVVVFGSYQIMDTQIRDTGQVVSVAEGRAIGGLNATGAISDLFHLEDALSSQLQRALNGGGQLSMDQYNETPTTAQLPSADISQLPSTYYVEPGETSIGYAAPSGSYSSAPYYYPPDYYYPPYYYSSFPFFGSGVIIINRNHRFDHGHDFDHDRDDGFRGGIHNGFRGGFGGTHFGTSHGFIGPRLPSPRPMNGGFRGGIGGGMGGFRGGMGGGFGGFHGGMGGHR